MITLRAWEIAVCTNWKVSGIKKTPLNPIFTLACILPATRVTLRKWPEKWDLGDQGWQGGAGEQWEHVGCKPSWVNSLYWLGIGKMFPLF